MTSAAFMVANALAIKNPSARWNAISGRVAKIRRLRRDLFFIVFGEADPPPAATYGVAAAVAAGEGAGAGEPNLKFTVGAFSAPCCAAKKGRGAKPNIPAIMFVGKRFTATL